MKYKIPTLALSATFLVTSMQAALPQTLFFDNFDGTGGLNGTTPDITQSSITWAADSDFNADGSVNGSGVAFLDIGTLINDNRGNANALYELETTFDVSDSTASDWLGVGFVQSPDAGNLGTIFSNSGNAGLNWLLHRRNGDIVTFTAQTTSASTNTTIDQGSLDVRMSYDLTDWNGSSNYGSVVIEAKLSSAGTYTQLRSYNLNATTSNLEGFGFSINGAPATIDSIRLSTVPEPSSFALLAGCFGLTWVMVRRRG